MAPSPNFSSKIEHLFWRGDEEAMIWKNHYRAWDPNRIKRKDFQATHSSFIFRKTVIYWNRHDKCPDNCNIREHVWRDMIDIAVWGFAQERYCICLEGGSKSISKYVWHVKDNQFQQAVLEAWYPILSNSQLHRTRVAQWETVVNKDYRRLELRETWHWGRRVPEECSIGGRGWGHWTLVFQLNKSCLYSNPPPLLPSSPLVPPYYCVLIRCLELY